LTDAIRPRAAMERLRARFPHALVLAFEPSGPKGLDPLPRVDRVASRPDVDIAGEFVQTVRGAPMSDEEQALLHHAWEACRIARAAAS
jgi:DNA repair protein SbcD/Mre11